MSNWSKSLAVTLYRLLSSDFQPKPGIAVVSSGMRTEVSGIITGQRAWIDNLKTISICVIVFGHAGFDLKAYFQPNSLEAMGVGPFFLILGYNLVRSKKSNCHLLLSRLFKLLCVGIASAFIHASIQFIRNGNFVESNFLPFFLGSNTFFINASVPGNPVLWFIGAYMHFVVAFAFLRKWIHNVTIMKIFMVFFLVEVVFCRIGDGITWDSYTFFLNWSAIFLLGVYIAENEKFILKAIKDNKKKILIVILSFTPVVLFFCNRWQPFVTEEFRFFYISLILFIVSTTVKTKKIIKLISNNTLYIFLFHCIILDFMPHPLPNILILINGVIVIIALTFIPTMINIKSFLNKVENSVTTKICHQ